MDKTPEMFDGWNEDKKRLQIFICELHKIIHKGQIRIYKAGVNLGNELSKSQPYIRPCLILNNHVGGDLVFIVPLTSKKKSDKFVIPLLNYSVYGLDLPSYLLLNQIRPISKKRLVFKINDKPNKEGTVIKLVPRKILLEIKSEYIKRIVR